MNLVFKKLYRDMFIADFACTVVVIKKFALTEQKI